MAVRFWTNDIAGPGLIKPKHGWDSGMIHVTANPSHRLKSIKEVPFQSLMDLPRAMEKVIIECEPTLLSGPRSAKYLMESKVHQEGCRVTQQRIGLNLAPFV
jgi:hypothetical protein